MEATVIGKRYAKALLNITEDANISTVGEELANVAAAYAESDEIRNVIAEPKIAKAVKVKVVGELASAIGAGKSVETFSRFLASKNRFDIIESVNASFEQLSFEKLGKATATVKVAQELSQGEVESLQTQLSNYTGKDVSLTVDIDPSILGGAITSIGSLVLDGSLKNRLNLLRETISKGN